MRAYEIDDCLQPEAVEREIASGTRLLVFAEPIEALFQRAGQGARVRTMTTTAIIAVVIYDLFLGLDYFLLPDVFATMVIARIGIFTPFMLGLVWMIRANPTRFRLESLSMVAGVIAVLLPTLILAQSDTRFKLNYQYTAVLIMMYTAVVQRVRFRYAVAMLVLSVTVHLTIIFWSRMFDLENSLAIAIFFLTSMTHLSLAAYILEHNERRGFLFALHATLLRDQITRASRTDALTGLYNRRYLSEVFDAVRESSPPRTVLAILLDIDHFKAFNDTCGHIEGDACLSRISACVAAVATPRGGDTFRFGGEEILVLVPGMEFCDGVRLAEEVRSAIEAAAIPHPGLDAGRVVTASLGVAGAVAPEVTLSDLIAAADTALYAAKRSGRNRVLPSQPPSSDEGGVARSGTARPHRPDPAAVALPAVLC